MWTVMAFTMRNKLRNKTFIITTVVLAVLLVVVGNLPNLLSKLDSNEPTKVGYMAGQQENVVEGLKSFYAKQEKPDIELISSDSEGSLKGSLENGDIKGYLTFKDNAEIGFPQVTYNSKSALGSGTEQALQVGLQSVKTDFVVKDVGLTDAQLNSLFAPVELKNVQVSFNDKSGKTANEQGTAMALVYVLIILLFMAVMITGQLIATEITAEKSSRVMEILVTSVSPLKQMFGKIMGTFVVGLVQIVILLSALIINIFQSQNMDALKTMGFQLDSIDPTLIVYAVFFYLTGFFLYSTLFAAVGSIVSRTEDLGQAVLPITMLTLVGFYIAIFGITHPDHILIVVCSYIPFFAPFIMFLRIGLSEPAWWEILLSIGILLASILAIGWLSA
jgi:ABC-2 type transport system permease protein